MRRCLDVEFCMAERRCSYDLRVDTRNQVKLKTKASQPRTLVSAESTQGCFLSSIHLFHKRRIERSLQRIPFIKGVYPHAQHRSCNTDVRQGSAPQIDIFLSFRLVYIYTHVHLAFSKPSLKHKAASENTLARFAPEILLKYLLYKPKYEPAISYLQF